MAAEMLIRPAHVADVPAVLPMVERTCALHQSMDPSKYGFLPHPAQRYESWLGARANDPRSVFLVADRQTPEAPTLVGFLVATTEREIGIYRLKEYGFIHDLWVEPAYRNEGLARQMMSLAIERFAQIGVAQVRLDVLLSNEPARRLFESCGFRPSTLEMLLELPASNQPDNSETQTP